MPLIAGVDSSTQSTKIEIRDQDSGEVVAAASSPHPAVSPPVSEQDPTAWVSAFESAWRQTGAPAIAAISIGGQQHGMVALDDSDHPVHPAKLWNDTESSVDAELLVAEFGPDHWADAVGSLPVAAFTVTKLAWLRRCRPDAWERLARVMLPHDYLTRHLTGRFTTDRGDASGTGYWSPAEARYRWDVLALLDADRDWTAAVPDVLAPLTPAGRWGTGPGAPLVAAGTGDNMAGSLGVGLQPGDAVISIGTSGTVYCVSDAPTSDATGAVAGFADATGRFLPLVCTSNAARVLDAVARLLGVDHDEFDRLALDAAPEGPVLLPYLDGERTPNRPDARGVLAGLRTDVTREQFARAAVDGVACGLLDGLDALRRHAVVDGRVILTGGASRSRAVRAVLAGLIDLPVHTTETVEAVATGAAVQAAAVLEQVDHATIQRRWGIAAGGRVDPVPATPDLRTRYAALRDRGASGDSV